MKLCFEKIEEAEKYLAVLPDERKEQIFLKKNEKHIKQSLAGEWLVRTMLEQMTGQNAREFVIIRDRQKKPYLVGMPYYFNISHAGEYVMAAVSSTPVGVDLEQYGRDISQVMQRICTGEDLSYIKDMESGRKTELWTRKEALVKCLGTGITDKRMKCIVGTGERILQIDGEQYRLSSPAAPEGYCCAVCEKMTEGI